MVQKRAYRENNESKGVFSAEIGLVVLICSMLCYLALGGEKHRLNLLSDMHPQTCVHSTRKHVGNYKIYFSNFTSSNMIMSTCSSQ